MSATPWKWTIEEAAARLRCGDLDVVGLTETMLARIEDLDASLHAFETVCADSARAEASRLAAELAQGKDRGPLHGIPIGIKDLCDTAGLRTAAGTRILDDRVPTEDATVVARLREAGCVMLGKLKMTEGAYALHHPDVVPPVNPWASDRWTGISSSGSGVATAAGLCFASLGTDTGGSIRFPSAANGVVGIKPTWGRVSRAGVFPLADSLDHVGPMARSVRDAATVLSVIAGHDDRDPTSLSVPVPDYFVGLERGVGGVRLGVDRAWMAQGMEPEIIAMIEEAAKALEGDGADLREIVMPATRDLSFGWAVTCAAEVAIAHEEFYPARAEEYGPALAGLIDTGRALDGLEYARMHQARLEFSGGLAALFETVDVVLCPAIGTLLPDAAGLDLAGDVDALEGAMRFTAPFDYSGSPTITLPCGRTADGLPVGLQLIGRHTEEALLCRVAWAYERLRGEASMGWPPLAS
ncbi:MAG: amidase [Hyphomicrobiaceae bacterium]|jgi:amidase